MQIIEKYYEFNSSAISCIIQKHLNGWMEYTVWHIPREFGVLEYKWQYQKLYERNIVYVKIDGQLSENFQTRNGGRGRLMLYDVYSEWIIQQQPKPGTVE